MAYSWDSNMSYDGALPNFERDYFEVLHNQVDPDTGEIIKKGMLDVKKIKMPKMFIAMCGETGKIYLWDKVNNTQDPEWGYWREIPSGDSSGIMSFDTIANMAAATVTTDVALAYCAEDQKTYMYIVTNDVDPITGKWRVFVTGSVNKEMVRCIAVDEIDPSNPPVDYNNGNYLYDCTNDKVYLYTVTWIEEDSATGHNEYSVTDVTDSVTMFECSITESLYENLDYEIQMRDVTWYVD